MRTLPLLLALACSPPADEPDETGVPADAADADTDADVDADADADADADTDTDTSSETGVATGCTELDLVPYVEARDATGTCATCTGPVDLAAGFSNPCSTDVTVTHRRGCLVASVEVDPPGFGVEGDCAGGVVQSVVPAGGILEVVQPFGLTEPGSYEARAVLSTQPPVDTRSSFDIR